MLLRGEGNLFRFKLALLIVHIFYSAYAMSEEKIDTLEFDSSNQAGEFSLNWYTIDNGGGRSENPEFRLHGTIGQTDTLSLIHI